MLSLGYCDTFFKVSKACLAYYQSVNQRVYSLNVMFNFKVEILSIDYYHAVKPVYNGHSRDPKIVAVVDRWSFSRGSLYYNN